MSDDDVKVSTPESLAAETSAAENALAPAPTAMNVAIASRQFAEVKGMIQLARDFPRDETLAFKHMQRVCRRKRFADDALYAFKRGDKIVSGPSIRLIEALVQGYRNIDYGFRIMEVRDDRSLVEAFAWDTENNIKARREFWVMHVRETKNGNYPITSPRDIYELCANMAQRRTRACIEEMLPVDLIEEAKETIKQTIKGGDGKPFEDRVRSLILLFDEVGVSLDMLEEFLGHSIKALVIEEFPRLRTIYNSIKNGVAGREQFFRVPPPSSTIAEPRVKETPKSPEAKPEPPQGAESTEPQASTGEGMSAEDKAILEGAQKRAQAKAVQDKATSGAKPEPASEAKDEPQADADGDVVDETTGEVLSEGPGESEPKPMSQEEMEAIQRAEAEEYEAAQHQREGVKDPTDPANGQLNLGDKQQPASSGGRKPRQARGTKPSK